MPPNSPPVMRNPVIKINFRFFQLYIIVFTQEFPDGIDLLVFDHGGAAKPVHKIDNTIGLFYLEVFIEERMYKHIGIEQRFFQQLLSV
jgi:hypothetical protein